MSDPSNNSQEAAEPSGKCACVEKDFQCVPSDILCQCAGVSYDDVRKQIIRHPHASFDEIQSQCDVAQRCGSCEPLARAYYEICNRDEREGARGVFQTKWKRLLTQVIRNFHLFSSLTAAIFLLFFAFSGYVMNHRAEFGLDEIEETNLETTLPDHFLKGHSKAEILSWCRDNGARGDLAEYIQDDDSLLVSYVCAGRRFEAEIDLVSLDATILIQKNGFLETLSEIHQSPSADGESTSLFIDVMAVLMAVVALSGIFLFFRMATRQNKLALVVFFLSVASAITIYLQRSGG